MKFNIVDEHKNASGVYIIRNSIDNRVYVGSAIHLQSRCTRHAWDLNKKRHYNEKLQHFVDKYGMETLSFELLELCPKEKILEREQHWLDNMDSVANGFNICMKAGNTLGYKFTGELYEQHRLKNKGRKQSSEVVERRKKSASDRWSKNPQRGVVTIQQLNNAGKVVQTFVSFNHCARYFGVNESTVKRWFTERGKVPHNLILENKDFVEKCLDAIPIHICESCGKEYKSTNKKSRFCSWKCRRMTPEQRSNRSRISFNFHERKRQEFFNTKTLTANGQIKTIAEWSVITGIPAERLRQRIYKFWDDEKIISTPFKPKKAA